MFTVILNICGITTKKIQDNDVTSSNIFPKIVFNLPQIESCLQKYFSLGKEHRVSQYLRIAIRNLHHQQVEDKLSVINELGQLAENHPQHGGLIMEALTSFVQNQGRDNSQMEVSNHLTSLIREEIQAALNVIISRNPQLAANNEQLDLSHTNLRGANLPKAHLAQVNFYRVNLAGANLAGANLSESILTAANLAGANLAGANLSGAILSTANLAGANLTDANLYRANLYLANLEQVVFSQTILEGANLREARYSKLNLNGIL